MGSLEFPVWAWARHGAARFLSCIRASEVNLEEFSKGRCAASAMRNQSATDSQQQTVMIGGLAPSVNLLYQLPCPAHMPHPRWRKHSRREGEKVGRSKTDPRNSRFGFVAKHRFHFIVGRPRTHVISRLDFGSRVYLRAQWELARSLAERRLLAERECLGRCARVGGHLHLHGDALQPRATCQSVL